MIVYDDVEPLEKIRVFDSRVERPPHYDTFGEFQYAYHYGDIYIPYIKQEEPLKTECQHFLDCIRNGKMPLTDGKQGLELVRILEASSESLKRGGAPVELFNRQKTDGWPAAIPQVNGHLAPRSPKTPSARLNGKIDGKKRSAGGEEIPIKIQMNGHQE
jgi:hypothetical protein